MVYIRFETGQENRSSRELGPYPFVQLTYRDLRVGPNGDTISQLDDEYWWFEGEYWSDVIVYTK